MQPDFSKIFHLSSKDHSKGHPPIPHEYEDWPQSWKTTFYKTYTRFPSIPLGDTPKSSFFGKQRAGLLDMIERRRSQREFADAALSKHELSILLKYSCGNIGPLQGERHRRAQPSGGGRFPIEVYPVIFRSSPEIPAGLYHYNVRDHALDTLWEREFNEQDIDGLFTYPWVKHASMAFIMTAVFERNQVKYGERGYRYVLLEAGHIGQNAYLVSEALGIKCCALTGTRDEALETLIDIDGTTESLIYALAVGK